MSPYHTHPPFVVANPSYDHACQILLDADYMKTRTFTTDDPTRSPETRFEMWYNRDQGRTVLLQVWRHIDGEPDDKGFTAYVDWPAGTSTDALKNALSCRDGQPIERELGEAIS